MTDDETAKCGKETVCFERVCDFNVNSSAKKTREQCSVPFVFPATLYRCKWIKIIYTNVAERQRWCHSILCRSAIFWSRGGALVRWHVTQEGTRRLRTAELVPSLQYFSSLRSLAVFKQFEGVRKEGKPRGV